MALPLALLGIGAAIMDEKVADKRSYVLTASFIRVVIAPLIGVLAAKLLSLNAEETRIALLFLACPTGVVTHVMTEQLGGDIGLSAGIIVISTILSIFSLGAVLAIF